MKVSERTIKAIQRVITGDARLTGGPIAPYQSGPDLVAFFNEIGFDDTYSWGGGFPSRWAYCEDNLQAINGTDALALAIKAALDPRRFLECEFEADSAAEYINGYLKFDGYEVRSSGNCFSVFELGGAAVEMEARLSAVAPATREFMEEQVDKCEKKLESKDYDGAITNARSLVESVLVDLESRLDNDASKYDGNLPRLYGRVRKLLNLDPAGKDADDVLRPILTGLVSVVSGLAATRNKMSDAHVRTYRPHRHHARLAVNAAKTLVDFLLDSYEYQREKGLISKADETARAGSRPPSERGGCCD